MACTLPLARLGAQRQAQRRRLQSLPATLRLASARQLAQLLDFVPVLDIDIVGRFYGIIVQKVRILAAPNPALYSYCRLGSFQPDLLPEKLTCCDVKLKPPLHLLPSDQFNLPRGSRIHHRSKLAST